MVRIKESQKLLIGVLLAVAIVVGLSYFAWSEREIEDEQNRDYKKFLQNMDKSMSSVRLGWDPSSSLKSAQSNYNNLLQDEDFDNGSDLFVLDNEIKNSFSNLISIKENARTNQVRSLRKDGTSMGESIGASLPFTYKFSSLIIVIISISLAFLSTVGCKVLIDWERLEDDKKTVEELEEKIREAQRGKGKRKRKMEMESGEAKKAKQRVWASSIKQAVFYLAPFLLGLPFLGFVYSDWIVAWLPFNWFTSGMFQSIGVSLNYLGWYGLLFFGFGFIWRELLISGEE